jgi:outer membrane protein OmpA-like peptidoglycan-associated protein
MSRQWKIVVPGCALALALYGCGDICSEVEPSAELSSTPAQQAEYVPNAQPPASAPGEQPPASASMGAARSCSIGAFPRNSSRLNNVDKACLDDVVQRLKADPRAHVVVIGHADAHERNAGTVSADRAEAVQDYLVEESGVDSGRIRVRSVGARRPLDSGDDDMAQARNRGCEVWFVPDGARDPS